MKFYKLELINREQSYNQMFGTTPSVGVMNPTMAKAKTTMPTQPQGKQMAMGGVSSMKIGGAATGTNMMS